MPVLSAFRLYVNWQMLCRSQELIPDNSSNTFFQKAWNAGNRKCCYLEMSKKRNWTEVIRKVWKMKLRLIVHLSSLKSFCCVQSFSYLAYLLNPSNLVYLLVIPNSISEYGDLRHKPRTIANFLHSLDLDSYLCQTIVKVQVNLTPRQASSAYRVAIILIV